MNKSSISLLQRTLLATTVIATLGFALGASASKPVFRTYFVNHASPITVGEFQFDSASSTNNVGVSLKPAEGGLGYSQQNVSNTAAGNVIEQVSGALTTPPADGRYTLTTVLVNNKSFMQKVVFPFTVKDNRVQPTTKTVFLHYHDDKERTIVCLFSDAQSSHLGTIANGIVIRCLAAD